MQNTHPVIMALILEQIKCHLPRTWVFMHTTGLARIDALFIDSSFLHAVVTTPVEGKVLPLWREKSGLRDWPLRRK